MNEDDKKFLLSLARKTIEKRKKSGILPEEKIEKLSSELKEKRGCFVTLNKNNNLRGCIGYILPIMPLYQAVIDNAYSAAFSDPRFPSVSESEINDLHIEISVLTVPERLNYKDSDELLNNLVPDQDGLIIKKGFYSSTFLPQVWEQLPLKEEFLGHLCMKAGLSPDAWKTGELEVEKYEVEAFEE